MSKTDKYACCNPDISEEDVLRAMQALPGHIDITPGDFKEVYRLAYAVAAARLAKGAKAEDIMTSPVHSVGLEAGLPEIASLLAKERISGVPVVDGQGNIAGVISEKDIFYKMGASETGTFMEVVALCLKSKGCIAATLKKLTAKEIMSAPAISAFADISASDIADIFTSRNINRLPIITPEGRPVGIVTRSDLVTSICSIQ